MNAEIIMFFFPCVNDFIDYVATFTIIGKTKFHDMFLGSWAWQNFSPVKILALQ